MLIYEPISLVGGLYKILAKVLADRLKKVINKVVCLSQSVFMEGRQILDVAFIANEAGGLPLDKSEKRLGQVSHQNQVLFAWEVVGPSAD